MIADIIIWGIVLGYIAIVAVGACSFDEDEPRNGTGVTSRDHKSGSGARRSR